MGWNGTEWDDITYLLILITEPTTYCSEYVDLSGL
jgi:hypothetical protein